MVFCHIVSYVLLRMETFRKITLPNMLSQSFLVDFVFVFGNLFLETSVLCRRVCSLWGCSFDAWAGYLFMLCGSGVLRGSISGVRVVMKLCQNSITC